jgi:hypothetical protein
MTCPHLIKITHVYELTNQHRVSHHHPQPCCHAALHKLGKIFVTVDCRHSPLCKFHVTACGCGHRICVYVVRCCTVVPARRKLSRS